MARLLYLAAAFVLVINTIAAETQETASSSNDQDVFAAIPEQTRFAFLERLKSVVRFQGAHDWSALYDLLAKPNPELKTDFLASQKKFDRHDAVYGIEFRPDFVTKLPENSERTYEWIVTGCAKYGIGKQTKYHQSSVYAVFHNGNWYFSELMINIRCGPNDPDPCQRAKASAKHSPRSPSQ